MKKNTKNVKNDKFSNVCKSVNLSPNRVLNSAKESSWDFNPNPEPHQCSLNIRGEIGIFRVRCRFLTFFSKSKKWVFVHIF